MQQQHFTPRDGQSPRQFVRRLDRLAGDMNAFLFAFAIGLAILDTTCFVAIRVSQAFPPLPPIVRMQAGTGLSTAMPAAGGVTLANAAETGTPGLPPPGAAN
jgi:hypothetical protein